MEISSEHPPRSIVRKIARMQAAVSIPLQESRVLLLQAKSSSTRVKGRSADCTPADLPLRICPKGLYQPHSM
jgi:hypothetical protein